MLDQDTIQHILGRIEARRKKDRDQSRNYSALCYCYSVRTQEFYVGYSGAGSVVVGRRKPTSDKKRRRKRVEPILRGIRQTLKHEIDNCAEVAALNNAIAWDESRFDLVFVTQHTERGIIPPCRQCKTWINEHCCGYIEKQPGAEGQCEFELSAARKAWQPGGERDRH